MLLTLGRIFSAVPIIIFAFNFHSICNLDVFGSHTCKRCRKTVHLHWHMPFGQNKWKKTIWEPQSWRRHMSQSSRSLHFNSFINIHESLRMHSHQHLIHSFALRWWTMKWMGLPLAGVTTFLFTSIFQHLCETLSEWITICIIYFVELMLLRGGASGSMMSCRSIRRDFQKI